MKKLLKMKSSGSPVAEFSESILNDVSNITSIIDDGIRAFSPKYVSNGNMASLHASHSSHGSCHSSHSSSPHNSHSSHGSNHSSHSSGR